MKNIIYNQDCITGLKELNNDYYDGCITDPPYNYEFIGHQWNKDEVDRRINNIKNSNTLVKNIPYGSGLAGGVRNKNWYKRNRENILEYSNWCIKWGKEIFRILKPGGFILVFNSTRTVSHIQVALENVGFYARDMLVWRRNSGIPRGINIEKYFEKNDPELAKKWHGWHSCLRNEWEAIVILQKPLLNNYANTVKKYGIGLFNAKNENGFCSNIIDGIRREKIDEVTFHCTVKPFKLIYKLLSLIIPQENNRIVIDPFMGSGTTALAALSYGIHYVGYEINKEYFDNAMLRIHDFIYNSRSNLINII